MSNGLTIYTASKTKHADKWKELRAQGYGVISTWIDEAGVGETSDFGDLWLRCIAESARADVTLVYAEEGEVLKGAIAEVGSALCAGRRVVAVGPVQAAGSWYKHPGVQLCSSIEEALRLIDSFVPVITVPLDYDPCEVCAGSTKLLSGDLCGICKGTGHGAEEKQGLREECFRLRGLLQQRDQRPEALDYDAHWKVEVSEQASTAPDVESTHKKLILYRAALEKISSIRDDIVARQRVNWSSHIYPLVSALGDAGFLGVGYEEARRKALTTNDIIEKLEEEVRELRSKLGASQSDQDAG